MKFETGHIAGSEVEIALNKAQLDIIQAAAREDIGVAIADEEPVDSLDVYLIEADEGYLLLGPSESHALVDKLCNFHYRTAASLGSLCVDGFKGRQAMKARAKHGVEAEELARTLKKEYGTFRIASLKSRMTAPPQAA